MDRILESLQPDGFANMSARRSAGNFGQNIVEPLVAQGEYLRREDMLKEATLIYRRALLLDAGKESSPEEPIKLLAVNQNTVESGVMPLNFGPAAFRSHRSYARQADADLKAFELVQTLPVSPCHKLCADQSGFACLA